MRRNEKLGYGRINIKIYFHHLLSLLFLIFSVSLCKFFVFHSSQAGFLDLKSSMNWAVVLMLSRLTALYSDMRIPPTVL